MNSQNNLLKAAKFAYSHFDFYRWFYDTKGVNGTFHDVSEVPLLTRADMFEFENKYGRSFDHDTTRSPDDIEIITSGSTGRSLSYWINMKHCNHLSDLFQYVGSEFGSGAIAGISKNTPLWMKRVLLSTDEFKTNIFDWIEDIGEVSSMNMIIDAACEGIKHLLNIDPLKNKLAYFTMKVPIEVEKLLNDKNISVVRLYGMTEFGVVGVCTGNISNQFTHYGGDIFEVYQQENNTINEAGTGSLVGTHTNEGMIFPLIRYLTQDVVDIQKHESGDCSITLYGRENSVKIPTDSELSINCESIFQSLKKQYLATPLEVLVLNVINHKQANEEQRIVLTLIEKNGLEKIEMAPENISEQIMLYGSGLTRQSYFQYFPTLFCPQGIIYNERNKPYRIVKPSESRYCEVFKVLHDFGFSVVDC